MVEKALSKLKYLLRLVIIQGGFLIFICCSASIGLVLLPLRQIVLGPQSLEEKRRVISTAIRLYLNLLKQIGLFDLKIEGIDKVSKLSPVIFVANHPSLLDALFFISKFPSCTIVVKSDLARFSPYTWVITAAGYIVNSGVNDVVEQATSELQQGRSVVIFPEGTRSDLQASQSLEALKNYFYNIKFQRGAAAIAIKSRRPLVPVLIQYTPVVLGKKQLWYQIPISKCRIQLSFLDPFQHSSINDNPKIPYPIQRREFSHQLKEFFQRKLIANRLDP